MTKLKHSKYKNTGILFELLVRKLTSETLSSDKSVTIDIIKKYFGKNTELAKELQLYNSLLKEQSNPKQLLECKNVIIKNNMMVEKRVEIKDPLIEAFESQPKDIRLLTYKLMIDKFNDKYSVLDESQKRLLNKYIINVNDTEALKEYIEKIIPQIKNELSIQAKVISDKATQIKVQKLSEMLCTVENMKTIKESHVLSLLRYFDLIKELKGLH